MKCYSGYTPSFSEKLLFKIENRHHNVLTRPVVSEKKDKTIKAFIKNKHPYWKGITYYREFELPWQNLLVLQLVNLVARTIPPHFLPLVLWNCYYWITESYLITLTWSVSRASSVRRCCRISINPAAISDGTKSRSLKNSKNKEPTSFNARWKNVKQRKNEMCGIGACELTGLKYCKVVHHFIIKLVSHMSGSLKTSGRKFVPNPLSFPK